MIFTQKSNYIINILIIALLKIPIQSQDTKLVFRNIENSIRIELTKEGNLKSTVPIKPNKEDSLPKSTKLSFKKSDGTKISLTSSGLYIKKSLLQNNTEVAKGGDLKTYTQDLPSNESPQAVFGAHDANNDGDLRIKGNVSDLESPDYSVAYVDNEGVFIQDRPDVIPTFAYANIENEGRTMYNGSTPGENYFYIKDHLGSTRMTIGENGSKVEESLYSAYGIEQTIARSSAGSTREKFTGKELDQDGKLDNENAAGGINLQYFGFRYYDPEVGIWTSPDPVEEFWNSYSYVGGNPVNFVDPLGLSVVGHSVGGGGGGEGEIDDDINDDGTNDGSDTDDNGSTIDLTDQTENDENYTIVSYGDPKKGSKKNSEKRDPFKNVRNNFTGDDNKNKSTKGGGAAALATTFVLVPEGISTGTGLAILGGIALFSLNEHFIKPWLASEKKPTVDDLKNNLPTHPDYKPPKNFNGKKVKNPNGKGSGYPDKKGNVWVPTDHKGTHDPHWDVQHHNGTHTPIYP